MVEEIMNTIRATEAQMEEIRKQAKEECERISSEGEEWLSQYEQREQEELSYDLEQQRAAQRIKEEQDAQQAREEWEQQRVWLSKQAEKKEAHAIELILKQLV